MKIDRTEILRVVKSMQTDAHQQRLALTTLRDAAQSGALLTQPDTLLANELKDTVQTIEDHIHALEHVIDHLLAYAS